MAPDEENGKGRIMIKRIDHLGIAVKDVEASAGFYRDILGLETEEPMEHHGMKMVFIKIGDSNFELIEDSNPDSVIAKYIERKGEGIHHVSLVVDDIEAELEAVKKKGVALIDDKPRIGAEGFPVAFLHPKSTNGVLVEFCQKEE
jgi:methylmalonyl-CoA epimerase